MNFWSYNQGGLGEILPINGSTPKPKGHEANGNEKAGDSSQ